MHWLPFDRFTTPCERVLLEDVRHKLLFSDCIVPVSGSTLRWRNASNWWCHASNFGYCKWELQVWEAGTKLSDDALSTKTTTNLLAKFLEKFRFFPFFWNRKKFGCLDLCPSALTSSQIWDSASLHYRTSAIRLDLRNSMISFFPDYYWRAK